MKLKHLLITIFIFTITVGCSTIKSSTEVTKISNNTSTSKELSSNPKENPVIRAEGISKFGSIIITSDVDEKVGQLGADSSYGKSSDYTFNADYNIIFKDLSNNKKIIGKIMHDNISVIIQPQNTPIKMQRLTLNEGEVFIFIPQYSGSNDVPLYIFYVDKSGAASQLKIKADNDSKPSDRYYIVAPIMPKFTPPSVEGNMLIIKVITGPPVVEYYKLAFKLDNNVLILTSKTLLN